MNRLFLWKLAILAVTLTLLAEAPSALTRPRAPTGSPPLRLASVGD
jgi:hypothetical protein